MPPLDATVTLFIKLNKTNTNIYWCDSLSKIEQKQDLISISLVPGLINLKANLLKCCMFLNT